MWSLSAYTLPSWPLPLSKLEQAPLKPQSKANILFSEAFLIEAGISLPENFINMPHKYLLETVVT